MIINADSRFALTCLPDQHVHCCVTSPPYFGLRDYGVDGQIGLEQTPEAYVAEMVAIFREVRRVLRDDGTLWLNLGDSYSVSSTYNAAQSLHTENGWKQTGESKATACHSLHCGVPAKNLIGIPWRVAFALQADGWCLRQDIIWHKPNPMPESVKDRCTRAHEYIFMFSKHRKYYFDSDAIKEDAIGGTKGSGASFKRTGSKRGVDGICPSSPTATHRAERDDTQYDGPLRNRRSVWTVATKPFSEAHFATFPPDLIEPCILAGCPENGIVLDPFFGAGTTGLVAARHNRQYIGIELNPEYVEIAERRLASCN